MTANDVFEITIDLISERLDSGLKDATNTINFEKRTPRLLNMIQMELSRDLQYTKTVNISSTDTKEYIEVDLPDDYLSFYRLTDSNLVTQTNYRIIGNKLYVFDDTNYILFYKYIPTTITALTDSMTFNDYINTTVIPNGLASQLLLTENVALANYFNQRYDELKSKVILKEPNEITSIIDKYDSKLSY
jgi:predicted glutamine amidotransferase